MKNFESAQNKLIVEYDSFNDGEFVHVHLNDGTDGDYKVVFKNDENHIIVTPIDLDEKQMEQKQIVVRLEDITSVIDEKELLEHYEHI